VEVGLYGYREIRITIQLSKKNLASGYVGKVYASNYNQYTPAIPGNRIVWEQMSSKGISNIYI
jgi:hypothetical protein